MKPHQILVLGKLRTVKLVTMPKLLAPPFRARQRSGLLVDEAVVIAPEARTTS